MAINREDIEGMADAIREVCEETSKLYARINWVLEHNSDMSIDWGAAEKPAYFDEAVNGDLDSRPFSRLEVSNAIFSLENVRKTLTNQAITQGDHLGNINKIARPLR